MGAVIPLRSGPVLPAVSAMKVLPAVTFVVASMLANAATAADSARLLFVGDVLLTREVSREIDRRGRSPWADMKGIGAADFAMANFEGAVGEGDGCTGREADPCFEVRPGMLRFLAEAGFKAVGIANNHAGDVGEAGRIATKNGLRKVGIHALDFEGSPGFARVGGHTLAVVAINQVAGRDGQIDAVPSLAVERKLRLARAMADWVVVFVHWGSELKDWPQDGQRRLAEWLVSNGVDLIVGHHPHVPVAPECIKGRPVFYSLGNHVFDQKYPDTKEGMLADCRISSGVLSCGPLFTHTPTGSSFPRIQDKGDTREPIAQCAVPAGKGMSIAGWRLRPWGERNQLVSGPMVIEGTAAGRKGWKVAGRQVLSIDAGSLVAGQPPMLLTVERHPSPIDNEDGPRPYVYDVTDHGLVARWRGSALAWPLIDARLVEAVEGRSLLCALHRADSFIQLDPSTGARRTALYQWNGFGFDVVEDEAARERCQAAFREPMP